MSKGRTVVCPVFGTFVPAASYIQAQTHPGGADDESQVSGALTLENLTKLESTSVCYAPCIQMLENLNLIYKDDGVANLNPY